jgi:hypothetical protein
LAQVLGQAVLATVVTDEVVVDTSYIPCGR